MSDNLTKNIIIIVFMVLSILSGFYVYYAKDYYVYCSHISIYNDYIIPNLNDTMKLKIKNSCEDVFNFNTEVNIYTGLIKLFYKMIAGNELNNEQNIKEKMSKTDIQLMITLMYVLKFSFMFLYIAALYFFIVIIPKIFLYFIENIVKKGLYIIFAILVVDFFIYFFKFNIKINIENVYLKIKSYIDLIKETIYKMLKV